MITMEKPEVKPASRYSIEQTCKLLGIHRNTLLRHTQKGIIKACYRKATMQKYYTGQEITRYWTLSM